MKRLVLIGLACGTLAAAAMPTRQELTKARAMVDDVTSADVKALKAGTKKPSEVAAAQMALAGKASSEAEKYLLLQGAFTLYAKAGDYDAAADALEAMVRDISDMRPDVIVEIYNKAVYGSMKDKAPRLYAIKESVRKAAANRKRLPALEKAVKAKPTDAAAQKSLGECQAELGDWVAALEAFAKAGGKLAETAKAEKDGAAKPQDLADFWWDYNEDANAYRLHAVAFYRDALADDGFQGLARERAERRIKEMEADRGASVESLALSSKLPTFKGGETFGLVLDSKKKTTLELVACPPGEFVMNGNMSEVGDKKDAANANPWWRRKHRVCLTYPFLIMKGPVSYEVADVINEEISKKGRSLFSKGTESILPDSPVMEISWDDIQSLAAKLNGKLKLPSRLKGLVDYEIRLPTEAEWRYAVRAGSDAKDWSACSDWCKEWAGYWWGKMPAGSPKGARCPFAPLAVMRKTANPWGLFYLGPKTIYADTFNGEGIEKDKDLCYLKTDVFQYADTETNPVRAYEGDPRAYLVFYGGTMPKLSARSVTRQKCPFRFVYAPKLSALNVYPRTVKDGPAKAIGGAVVAPAKSGVVASAKPLSFDLGKGIKLELYHCPAGTFQMSNAPGGPNGDGKHEVRLTRAYWIADQQVTEAMYGAFDEAYNKEGKRKQTDLVTGRAQAEAFAAWLNAKFGSKLPDGYVFRLPTEAELECAQQKGAVARHWSFEGTLDTAQAVAKKANAWKYELSVMDYGASEVDPVRVWRPNPAWVCRQNVVKRFLLPFNGNATFRMAVGPDLLSEKAK